VLSPLPAWLDRCASGVGPPQRRGRIFVLKLLAVCAALMLAVQPALAVASTASSSTLAPLPCASRTQNIDEKGFVSIGGIEQWVTVKGDSCANPIILFLSGGPGNPLSPFSDAVFGAWSKDFTVVQWDQRGAGMTYGRSPPAPGSTLTMKQMSDDGAELTAYLTHRFGKKKVILWGSSWGSLLGVHMTKAHPQLFYAYLGTAQGVSYRENEAASYTKLLGLARAADDSASIAVLVGVGAPPWTDPRSFGKVRRVVRKYEAKVTTPAPQHWWKPAAEYTTAKAMADHEAGEEFSFLAFVGLNGDGMFSQVDLPKLGTDFAIPMFFVHGAQAPQKAFVLVERAGHDPSQDIIDAQYKLLMTRILPLTK
jgi:pimeloyl-ACP methyl ester carboxylesterase